MMRLAVVLTILLWVLMVFIRVQWVWPGQTVSVEVACGGVFVMHNADGFHSSGLAAQTGLAIPFPLPASVEYGPTLSAWFMPAWWVPVVLWICTRLKWLLRMMRVLDVFLMLIGVLFAAQGFMASARSQVNPDTIIPLAIGIPFLMLGYKGLRAVSRYHTDPATGSTVIINIWLTGLAWGLATLFGKTGVMPVIIIVGLAVLITWNISRTTTPQVAEVDPPPGL